MPAPLSVPFPPHLSSIDIGSYHTDSRLFSAATGWTAHCQFAAGVHATLAFFREHLPAYLSAGEQLRRDLPEHQGIQRRLEFKPVDAKR